MLDHQYIKKLAADAGFDLCGLAPCRHLAENESMLRAWLGKGYQSSLAYMERQIEQRADPRKLVEGARTAVVLDRQAFTTDQLSLSEKDLAKQQSQKDPKSQQV